MKTNNSGSFLKGSSTKLYKDILEFKRTNTKIITNDSDNPTTVAKEGDEGTIYIQDGTGDIYIKQDTGSSTNWFRAMLEGSTLDLLQFNTGVANPSHNEGLLFYDQTKKTLSYYNEEADVTVNLGRELLIRVYNNSGSTITNGSVVYPMGNVGGIPAIELANATSETTSKVVGVVTHDIEDGTIGYVAKFGQVGDLNTSAYAVGDILYLSDTDGQYTTTKPTGGSFITTIGVVETVNATTGSIVVDIIASQLSVEVTDTNGFPSSERTGTTLSIVNGTRTFTIAPTGSDFHYYIEGQKYEKTSSEDVVFTDTEGIHVVYYDGSTLTALANPTAAQVDSVIRAKAIVAYFYWDATNSEVNYFGDERHGISMSPETHSYLHFTRGFQYLSGLAVGDIIADDDAASDASAQFSVSSGFATDEDLITSYSAIGSTTGLPIYYLDGANGNLRRDTNAGFSVLTTGTGKLAYNEWTGATWQLTEVANRDFVLYHVFAVNGYTGKDQQISVVGQNDYATITLARAGAQTEIASLLTMLPGEEIVPVATIIFETRDAWTNAVKATIRSTDTGEDYVNWLTTELASGNTPSSHNNLTNLELSVSGTTWGHIDDQAQTIAGAKTFSDALVASTSLTSTGNLTASSNIIFDGQTVSTVSTGVADNDKFVTKGYVDDEIDTAVDAVNDNYNWLINGDMRLTQRGDFTTASAATSGVYYLDRWEFFNSTVTANKQQITTSQPSALSGSNSLLATATSTATGTIAFRQIIEDFELFAGKSVTFSAWIKSNSTDARLCIYDGVTSTCSSGHTGGGAWELLTVTKSISASNTLLQAYFNISASDRTDVAITTGDYIEATGAKLELGSAYTAFVPRQEQEELKLAQRYCRKLGKGLTGVSISATTIRFGNSFDSLMYSAPTVSLITTAIAVVEVAVGKTSSGSSIVTSNTDEYGFRNIDIDGWTGLTSGSPVFGNTSPFILLEAEL